MNKVDFKKKCQAIKLVVVDVDGVLTDGGVYYSKNDTVMKKFNIRDGAGVALLQLSEIRVGILTTDTFGLSSKRCWDIGVDFIFDRIKDKLICLNDYLLKENYNNQEVAYIGDEINDYCLLSNVGVFFAPADANIVIKDKADYVLQTLGGQGVLREVAQILLDAQGCYLQVIDAYTKNNCNR